MTKTAVEWLIEELKKVHHPTEAMIMYAKKLEKQQIVDAYKNGQMIAEQYYNEAHGSKGSDGNFKQFSLYEHKETITSSDTITSSQTEISDDRTKLHWKTSLVVHTSEISDEEIQEGVDEHFSADDMVTERFAFKLGANWYKASLKSKQNDKH